MTKSIPQAYKKIKSGGAMEKNVAFTVKKRSKIAGEKKSNLPN